MGTETTTSAVRNAPHPSSRVAAALPAAAAGSPLGWQGRVLEQPGSAATTTTPAATILEQIPEFLERLVSSFEQFVEFEWLV
mmetsp:Transcript_50552/g.109083  ORF Transcript_50552/g.109083 Transcript_50552/m.109083 type:complete len:82 (+) Transcript_50552:97-342(+)